MEYFRLKTAAPRKISGTPQGISQAYLDEQHLGNLQKHLGFTGGAQQGPGDDFVLEGVNMWWYSKPTDFISCRDVTVSSNAFIISERVVGILEQIHLPAHHICPALVYHRDHKYRHYRYFYLSEALGLEHINFAKSTFFHGWTGSNTKIKDAYINDLDDYLAQRAKAKAELASRDVRAERLVLNLDENTDIFKLGGLGRGIYISRRLLDRFVQQQITGYEATPVDGDGIVVARPTRL